MKAEDFTAKIIELLNTDKGIHEKIKKYAQSVITSEYAREKFLEPADNTFLLPKTVLSAVFEKLAHEYEPFYKDALKIKKELKHII